MTETLGELMFWLAALLVAAALVVLVIGGVTLAWGLVLKALGRFPATYWDDLHYLVQAFRGCPPEDGPEVNARLKRVFTGRP